MAVKTFSLDAVASLTDGKVLLPASGLLRGLCLDSRKATPGAVFAALPGARADGHDFAAAAATAGCGAVLAQRPVDLPPGTGLVIVASVERAVRDLGVAVRGEFRGEVAGVVGSCGKTTTKDFTAALLAMLGPVQATAGNRNNLLGLPETLMASDLSARFWVLELGISQPGEMAELAPVARPTAVIFTTIQPVHLEFFPSLEAIRDEKARVLGALSSPGLVVVNGDDPLLRDLPAPAGASRVTYGTGGDCEIRVTPDGPGTPSGTPFRLRWPGGEAGGLLPVPGPHNLMNFAAAAAAAWMLGLDPTEAAGAAVGLRPAARRGVTHLLPGDVLLLDDSYNANPAAVASVLRSTRSWNRRVVAALGEMLELGPSSADLHRATGETAAREGVAALLTVGGEAALAMGEAFGRSGRPWRHTATWKEGGAWLKEAIAPGDGVVVKGSRGIGLDGLADWLLSGGDS